MFLGGLIDENGAQVIKDKVAVLGPNDGDVKLFAPDGFTTQQTIDEAPEAAAGMFMSVAGVPIDEFEGAGAEFAEALKPRLGGKPIDPYAIYGAQAAQVMLDAIAASDGSRADVIAKMFEAKVKDGYSAASRSTRTAIRAAPRAPSSASRSTRRPTSSRPRRRSPRSRRTSRRRGASPSTTRDRTGGQVGLR